MKVHHRPYSFEDGPVVYPANAFDSSLRGDYYRLVQVKKKKKKKIMSFLFILRPAMSSVPVSERE